MFQYVLFDLDGTLTDPKIGITTCVQYALKYYGITEENLDNLTPFIGPPLKDSFMEFYGFDGKKAEEAIEKYRERFSTVGLYENDIYPGVDEMLQKLREAGVHLAVASSKPTVFVEKILKHFHIEQYFEVVVGSELDGRRTDKEEVVSEALRKLGVTGDNRSDCAMVGDRKFDIIGAKAHKVCSVGVTYGYAGEGELEKENPDYVASDVDSLTAFLLGETKKRRFCEPYFTRVKKAPVTERNSFTRAFSIISPIFIYYIVSNLIVFGFAYFISYLSESGNSGAIGNYLSKYSYVISVCIKFISMAFAAGLLIPSFLEENPILFQRKTKKRSVILILAIGSFASLFLNVLFSLLNFTESSKVYGQVAANQFSLSLAWGILLYGIVSPITEEIVFRGLVYNRLRRTFSLPISLITSSLLFGIYHGNIVQAFYGFLLGLLIAWIYEKYGSFLMPVLIHSTANITIYIIMSNQYLKHIVITPIFCLLLAVVTAICMILICTKSANK